MFCALLRISLRSIEAGADGSGAHIDGIQVLFSFTQRGNFRVYGVGKTTELLTHRHWHGVLHLRAAHLQNFHVGVAFGPE